MSYHLYVDIIHSYSTKGSQQMQAMTGRAIAPLARSNDPISIFKTEGTPHTSRKTQPAVTDEQRAATDALNASTELEQAQAERKALAARIKELKAERKAARLSERESELSNVLVTRLAGRVRSHIKAGESQEQALDAVFQQYREAVIATLAQPASTDEPEA
jgi:hypothetical protein